MKTPTRPPVALRKRNNWGACLGQRSAWGSGFYAADMCWHSEMAARAGMSRMMLSRLDCGEAKSRLSTLAGLTTSLFASLSQLSQAHGGDLSPGQLVRPSEALDVVRRGTKRGHTRNLLAAIVVPVGIFEPRLAH